MIRMSIATAVLVACTSLSMAAEKAERPIFDLHKSAPADAKAIAAKDAKKNTSPSTSRKEAKAISSRTVVSSALVAPGDLAKSAAKDAKSKN